MVITSYRSTRASRLISQSKNQYPYFDAYLKDSLPSPSSQPPPDSASPSGRISPAALFIIVILALVFFISGLVHLLVRFLIKKHPFSASFPHPDSRQDAASLADSDALQRQLQQLFHLHDSGLDQAFIDALPVFLYKEIIGSKEPFDCAVCLCEFAREDKLRLLPSCGHAFHISCIDTWLLSNSTCPLCRGALFAPGLGTENPIFAGFEDLREEDELSREEEEEAEGAAMATERRLFSVRLGKFKNLCSRGVDDGISEGETSSNKLDARRCFSMGSYQYVVAEANLRVALNSLRIRNGQAKEMSGMNENSTRFEALERKKLSSGSRGESFSVSKIWQWSNNKGKFPVPLDNYTSPDENLSWIRNARDT
ncbi:hypothetical protein Cni_G00746 [Canna indica]|uniref:RING-type E3 ubiquitin transferase n=1 Tax=Canna indica TaxID=4628 RepID=A0AAQ3PX57_9LILI|nr:hypothetical protein Cni_G00746 [Canna indica]